VRNYVDEVNVEVVASKAGGSKISEAKWQLPTEVKNDL
jgi:hypothetical protein